MSFFRARAAGALLDFRARPGTAPSWHGSGQDTGRGAHTYAHAGSWFTEEEKFTVAAEKEYSEETGFNLKRLNYGRLGERIDH